MFFLRVGYNSTWKRDTDARTGEASLAYFTAGAGLNLSWSEGKSVGFDYAFQDLGQLDSVHRFTLGLNF